MNRSTKALCYGFLLSGTVLYGQSASSRKPFTIYLVDRGINSRENLAPVVLNSEPNPPLGFYPLQMPVASEFPNTNTLVAHDAMATFTADLSNKLSGFVSTARKAGRREVEIRTGLDIKSGGYLMDDTRIANTEAFISSVAQALMPVKHANEAQVAGIFGSFGGQAFTDISLTASGKNANPVDQMILVNARASLENTISACQILPACTIITSKGDFPSLQMGMGDKFRRVANRKYAEEAYDRTNGKIAVIDTDAKGIQIGMPLPGDLSISSHVWLENAETRQNTFRYRTYEGNGRWSDWSGPISGDELLVDILSGHAQKKEGLRSACDGDNLKDCKVPPDCAPDLTTLQNATANLAGDQAALAAFGGAWDASTIASWEDMIAGEIRDLAGYKATLERCIANEHKR